MTDFVTAPAASDVVAQFTGSVIPVETEHAEWALDIASALVRAYTRGRGFEDDEMAPEIAAVIALVACRLAPNAPQHSAYSWGEGGFTERRVGSFQGLTLIEQTSLAPWRRTLGTI